MMPAAISAPKPPRARSWSRRCRICLLLALLGLAVAVTWLDRVGVPDALQSRIQTSLRKHGADLRFEQLVWRWYRGLVARNVTIELANGMPGARAVFEEAALDLKWDVMLRRRQWEISSIELLRGQALIPLTLTNDPPDQLELRQVSARLRFLPGNIWELDEFSADVLGSTFHAAGTVTNANALFSAPSTSSNGTNRASSPVLRSGLRQLVRVCRQFEYAAPPDIHLNVRGDALESARFALRLRGTMSGAITTWGRVADCRMEIDIDPKTSTNTPAIPQLSLHIRGADTPYGRLDHARVRALLKQGTADNEPLQVDWDAVVEGASAPHLTLQSTRLRASSLQSEYDPWLWHTIVDLTAENVKTDWVSWRDSRTIGSLTHSLTNLSILDAAFTSTLHQTECRWGKADSATLASRIGPAKLDRDIVRGNSWGWWTNLASNKISLDMSVHNVSSSRLDVSDIDVAVDWQAPELRLSNLDAKIRGGLLRVRPACLNVETRVATASLLSEFDVHAVGPLIGTRAERWLSQFDWSSPPWAEAGVTVLLPPWTSASTNWLATMARTCRLEGKVQGRDASYRGVSVSSAALHVSLSNEVLRLTDFKIKRPEGHAALDYELDTRSREFRWLVSGLVDAGEVGPAIDKQAPRLLDFFVFTEPTSVQGEVWGCWKPPKRVEHALDVAATNFTFRGEQVDRLAGSIRKTNHFLTVTGLKLEIGEEWIDAPEVSANLDNAEFYITNLQCRIDPLRVARAIGSNVVNTLQPYRFDQPPLGRVNGRIAFPQGVADPNLVFDVAGGPFHFWRLNAPEIAALVHWTSDSVSITNVAASFHQGRLTGHVDVDLADEDTAVRFSGRVTNANLDLAARDLLDSTNRLEGTVSATLDVVGASAADVNTWDGSGQVEMRNGVLWDLPIFGVFSPVLNALSPGLGNSRARSAKASYSLHQAVLRTDDLGIEAGLARLRYRGTVDLNGNVNARVEAEILASTPFLGPLISIALTPLSKALVYKVGGTLEKPELDPLYVPKLLMPFLRPFQTLKSILPPSTPAQTPDNSGNR